MNDTAQRQVLIGTVSADTQALIASLEHNKPLQHLASLALHDLEAAGVLNRQAGEPADSHDEALIDAHIGAAVARLAEVRRLNEARGGRPLT